MPLFCVAWAMSSWKRRSASSLMTTSVLVLAAHFRDQFRKVGQLCIVDARCGQRAGFAFDRAPRFEQFEWADVLATRVASRRCPVDHIDTGAGTHVHQLVELERDDGFANRGGAIRKGLRQLPLGSSRWPTSYLPSAMSPASFWQSARRVAGFRSFARPGSEGCSDYLWPGQSGQAGSGNFVQLVSANCHGWGLLKQGYLPNR